MTFRILPNSFPMLVTSMYFPINNEKYFGNASFYSPVTHVNTMYLF